MPGKAILPGRQGWIEEGLRLWVDYGRKTSLRLSLRDCAAVRLVQRGRGRRRLVNLAVQGIPEQ